MWDLSQFLGFIKCFSGTGVGIGYGDSAESTKERRSQSLCWLLLLFVLLLNSELLTSSERACVEPLANELVLLTR